MSGLPLEGVAFPGEWALAGRCRQAPLEAFFPGRGESTAPAKQICSRCAVLQECRDYAVPHDQLLGVWGGMSAHEREQERSQRHAAELVAASREQTAAHRQTAPGALLAALEQLAHHPGRWARVARYRSAHSASATASLLRSGRRKTPPGRWEFEGRINDTGGSDLYARLLDETETPNEGLAS